MTRGGGRLSPREYSHASGLATSIALKTSQKKAPRGKLSTFEFYYVGDAYPSWRHFLLTVRVSNKFADTSVLVANWEINLSARELPPH